MTAPAEALSFVEATAVAGLDVAVGSSHAMVDRTATLETPARAGTRWRARSGAC